jgi:hypothetical protein
MIESPLLQKMMAGAWHRSILDLLKDRFGTTPREIMKPLRAVLDEKKLRKLNLLAAKCPDLEAFHEALLS